MNIGIARKHPRLSDKEQRARLIEWGANPQKIWLLGNGGQNLKKFLDARVARKGDKIGICRLALLIDPGHGTHDKMAADVKALLTTGATLCELETGRTWDDRGDLVHMVTDAIKQISTGRVGAASPGRPRKHVYTPDQETLIRAIWSSKDYTNDNQREAAVQAINGLEGFKRTVMHRWLRADREAAE